MNNKTLTNTNLTAVLYRFVKLNGAYPYFKEALKTSYNGRKLLDTLYALRFDPQGKKEPCANDPIKWIFLHSQKDGQNFLRDFFNEHIKWSESKPNLEFWRNLHYIWQKDFYPTLFSSDTVLTPIISFEEAWQECLRKKLAEVRDFETETESYWLSCAQKACFFTMISSLIVTYMLCVSNNLFFW